MECDLSITVLYLVISFR